MLRRPACVALCSRSALRSAPGGKRDRVAHLSPDRVHCAERADRARGHLDRCCHPLAWIAAVERAASTDLWHSAARERALFHADQARNLPTGDDGWVFNLAARISRLVSALRR